MRSLATVVVLAGGRSLRFYGGEYDRQKVLEPLHGRPFIQHVLDRLHDVSGLSHIVLLTGTGWSVADEAVFASATDIPVSCQAFDFRKQDLALAVKDLGVPIIVIAGDVLLDYGALISSMRTSYEHRRCPVVAYSRSIQTSNHYAVECVGGFVTGFRRRAPEAIVHAEVVDAYVLDADVLQSVQRYGLSHTSSIRKRVEDGNLVAGVEYEGDWYHLEVSRDLDRLENCIGR